MFGADHFIFYNISVSTTLQPYIDHYLASGKIEIVQWDLPVIIEQGPKNEIHYFGQLMAISDCLYRAYLSSQFVVFLDMDEVIVPMKSDSWLDIIPRGIFNKTSAAVIRNTFFRKEWNQDTRFAENQFLKRFPIDALLYTKREQKIWSAQSRSKYIARPECIDTPGIHFPFKLGCGTSFTPNPSDAIMMHYRNWEDYNDGQPQIQEQRMHVFSEQILKRVQTVVEMVENQKPA